MIFCSILGREIHIFKVYYIDGDSKPGTGSCLKAEYSPALLALGWFLSKARALSDEHPDSRASSIIG